MFSTRSLFIFIGLFCFEEMFWVQYKLKSMSHIADYYRNTFRPVSNTTIYINVHYRLWSVIVIYIYIYIF